MQIFVDLDGVLADFDALFLDVFGFANDRDGDEPPDLWERLNTHPDPGFFRSLPVMPGAHELWDGLRAFHTDPVVLSGVPKSMALTAARQKRAWLDHHFGPHVFALFPLSKNKRDYGKPGDILIDDWPKYRHLWEEMGGVFVLHTSAASSLAQLAEILEGAA